MALKQSELTCLSLSKIANSKKIHIEKKGSFEKYCLRRL